VGDNPFATRQRERVKLLKLLWDCMATGFSRRHEFYEINSGGSTEEIRRYFLFGAQASGNADRFNGLAEECMGDMASTAGRCRT
jgi:aromatic ring hydroxylase